MNANSLFTGPSIFNSLFTLFWSLSPAEGNFCLFLIISVFTCRSLIVSVCCWQCAVGLQLENTVNYKAVHQKNKITSWKMLKNSFNKALHNILWYEFLWNVISIKGNLKDIHSDILDNNELRLRCNSCGQTCLMHKAAPHRNVLPSLLWKSLNDLHRPAQTDELNPIQHLSLE